MRLFVVIWCSISAISQPIEELEPCEGFKLKRFHQENLGFVAMYPESWEITNKLTSEDTISVTFKQQESDYFTNSIHVIRIKKHLELNQHFDSLLYIYETTAYKRWFDVKAKGTLKIKGNNFKYINVKISGDDGFDSNCLILFWQTQEYVFITSLDKQPTDNLLQSFCHYSELIGAIRSNNP